MMKSLLKRVVFGSATLGILATSFSVLAMPPHDPNAYDDGNVWRLIAYDDDSSNHNPISTENRVICFDPWNPLNMHAEYKKWRDILSNDPLLFSEEGGARQEGDQIFMVGDGDGPDEDWHDNRQWEMTSRMKGYGHLQRWNETSGEHVWYKIELARLSGWSCECDSLAKYLSTIDVHIDNIDTLEQLLSTSPACSSDEAEPAPSEEVAK